MSQDRIGSEVLPFTHESPLASMLETGRAIVSIAQLPVLQKAGLIE